MPETEKPGPGAGVAHALPGSRFTSHAWHEVRSTLKQICGMPDYERYLAHRRARHPGEPVLSRKAHYLDFVQRRYAGGGSRCC